MQILLALINIQEWKAEMGIDPAIHINATSDIPTDDFIPSSEKAIIATIYGQDFQKFGYSLEFNPLIKELQ